MKNHCNVLLLALSTFPKKSDGYVMTESKFSWKDEKEYTGIYQLDPVPKMLIDQLGQKGESLDKIIMLATSATSDEKKEVKITYLDEKDEREKSYPGTEQEYFQSQIEKEMLSDCSDIAPKDRFTAIRLDEKNPERGINEAVETVRGIDNIRLYFDTHGGFREISLVLEAIISLLKMDQIEVQGIYGVEYDPNSGNKIIDARRGFQIFDFVSGMNEFINYGRINSLETFLEKNTAKDPSIKEQQDAFILCMRQISEGIQLCNIPLFEEGLDKLAKYYENYKEKDLQKDYSYLSIFVKNIEKDYGPLLNRDGERKDYGPLLKRKRTVIDEIEWCQKKGFYQQALTLIESRVPKYLEESGLCKYYSEYEKDATSIFNYCIPWRYKKNERGGAKGIEEKELPDRMPEEERVAKMKQKKKWYPYRRYKKEYVDDKNKKDYVEFIHIRGKEALLDEFLTKHMELKDIRNQANHALERYKMGLADVDKKITEYLEMLEKLCS